MSELTISIVGFGKIGKLICALLLSKSDYAFSINILDVDESVIGAIKDLKHGNQLFPNHAIVFNDRTLFQKSDFIFQCAGASVPKGKSRLDICQESIEISEAIFADFKPNKAPFIIVVANPVEVISSVIQQLTGLPKSHVLGTGTFLDSLRMNEIIASKHQEWKNINTVLLGEHGSSAFLSEELSTIDGAPVSNYFSETTLNEYMDLVKKSAEEIKSTQGATMYGVSFCALRIFELLLSEKGGVLPVSTAIPEQIKSQLGEANVYLSFYSTIDKNGVRPVESYRPKKEELALLKTSYELIVRCFPDEYAD